MSKRFKNWKMPKIVHGKMTKYNWLCLYPDGLKLGKFTDISAFSLLVAKYGIEIGDGAELGSHTSIYSFSTVDNKYGKVVIGKNAKLGSHCVVFPGVTVGENSIIGACSLVNKNIPANVVAYGVPAKVKRKLRKGENGVLAP